MARKHDDAALMPPALCEDQVVQYLEAHPDFLIRHAELALTLSPPSRWTGEADGIVDMQIFLNDRLRDELERLRGAAEHLIHTSRSNMSTQQRTHRAVLSLLGAQSLEQLVQAISDDLPALLDVDVATLCFEMGAEPLPELAHPGIGRLPDGAVARMMGGPDRDCALSAEMPGDPAVFGGGAGLVQSSAVVRVTAGGRIPPGAMALGSRFNQTFHQGQGTELITFLARVVECCLGRLIV